MADLRDVSAPKVEKQSMTDQLTALMDTLNSDGFLEKTSKDIVEAAEITRLSGRTP